MRTNGVTGGCRPPAPYPVLGPKPSGTNLSVPKPKPVSPPPRPTNPGPKTVNVPKR